ARRVRPLHLDRDSVPVRKRCPVDLADRRGGDRRLLELGEELGDRELEILLDHALDVLVRERADVVLECLQLEQDVRRNDGGARGSWPPDQSAPPSGPRPSREGFGLMPLLFAPSGSSGGRPAADASAARRQRRTSSAPTISAASA